MNSPHAVVQYILDVGFHTFDMTTEGMDPLFPSKIHMNVIPVEYDVVDAAPTVLQAYLKDKVIIHKRCTSGRSQNKDGTKNSPWCMVKISNFYKNVISKSGFQVNKRATLIV